MIYLLVKKEIQCMHAHFFQSVLIYLHVHAHIVLFTMHKAAGCCQNFDYFVADKQYILFVECA